MQTPSAMIPQYLFMYYEELDYFYDEKNPDSIYQGYEKRVILKYYDRVSEFYYWN